MRHLNFPEKGSSDLLRRNAEKALAGQSVWWENGLKKALEMRKEQKKPRWALICP